MVNSAARVPAENSLAVGDTLALGVFVMLVVNTVQRGFGLLRGIGFAHFLSDVELGHWALINSFFVVAVPVAVLGLPGSLGKFAEYFRVRNQFAGYFRLVILLSLSGVVLSSAAILFAPQAFGLLIFCERISYPLVIWCVVVLASVIAFSFVSELNASFREVRTVSHMQFAQSLTFTVVGLMLVATVHAWWVLLPSFAIAQWAGILPGWWKLRTHHRQHFHQASSVSSDQILRRIAPYAVTLWAVNLLSNLFEVVDRYMLLHLLSHRGGAFAQAVVGQYHCARILPNLLSSVAIMLGGVLLPYLSADWERGNGQRIANRIRQLAHAVCLGSMAIAAASMLAAPYLFHFAFGARYELALQVLPIALLQVTWMGMFLVAEPYLLCAERGKELVWLLLTAFIANLLLNVFLIPIFGLHGGMLATAAASLLAVGLLYWRLSCNGCWLGRASWLLLLAPTTIVFGPQWTVAGLLMLVVIAGRTEWLLAKADREHLDSMLLPKLSRYGIRLNSLWP